MTTEQTDSGYETTGLHLSGDGQELPVAYAKQSPQNRPK